MNPRVAAVVPVLDERDAIGDVIRGLARAEVCCAIVVDGGSRDGTTAVAEAAGARVVHEPRRGYGQACLTGAAHALRPAPDGHGHEAVAFLDGDGSCDPADLPRLVDAMTGADLVMGRRPARALDPGAMAWHARAGNALVAAILSARTGRRVRDLPPLKVIRSGTLEGLALDETGFGWTVQLVARALAEPSTNVLEVPARFRARRGGVSKVSGSWLTSLRAGRSMIRTAIRETRPGPVVALMAKAPGHGHAKTRLAAELGEEATAELWTACVADVAGAVLARPAIDRAHYLVMLPRQDDVEPMRQIIGRRWIPVVQDRPGLAAALGQVFLEAFDRGADRALAVAGDAPALPPERIDEALRSLARGSTAAVIGPSSDGGYYLVGLRWRPAPRWLPRPLRARVRTALARRLRSAFTEVEMGAATAREATIAALRSAGWRVEVVGSWPDVDTVADLRSLAARLVDDGRWAPRTRAWIVEHPTVVDSPAEAETADPAYAMRKGLT